jgi:tetratricopeptide (TPR) repeat protein
MRSRAPLCALLAWSLACSGRDSGAQPPGGPAAALRLGRYDEAIAALQASAPSGGPAEQRLLVRALLEVGRHDDAETAARRFATSSELATSLGTVLQARGKLAEAEQAFERALAGRASDSLTARLHLAVLHHERGDAARAGALFEQVAAAGERGSLSAEQLLAVGTANRYLGHGDPQRFRLALRAFDAAAERDTLSLEPRVRVGELFLEKYNATDAARTFTELLAVNPRHPRALLGAARVRQFDGAPGATALVDSSLRTNPNFVAARLFLASTHLDAEDYARAATEVERALAVDSTSLDALSLLAAVRHLQGDARASEAARRRVLARNPRHAELYATLAELSARHRQYGEAATLAARGVRLDPTSWRSHSIRGMNQLRLGQVDSARASLETAFAGDPYDVWVKNTLDLLDATRGYRTERSARFVFVADSTESALLALYLGELLEDGYDRLAARYGYRPPTPIRMELYRRHADFSVRTVGLAGLGALGVSFGTVLAMDAPSARDVGEFHWGSTAWHELAHTFTLGATDNRVPRWLSEGLSVAEERRARPGWGDGPTPEFLAAYKGGGIPPVHRLNDGFMRPAYPQQVQFSYYAASLVTDLIERDFGPRAIPELLGAYREGLSTDAAIQRALEVDVPTLGRRFDAYMRERFAGPLAVVGTAGRDTLRDGGLSMEGGSYARALAEARAALAGGDRAAAIAAFARAKAMFPEVAVTGGPSWQLAMLYKATGDTRRAAAELSEYTARNGGDYAALLELATMLESTGDRKGAADALERAIYVSPYDPAVHTRLATLATALGERARAVRERRAVVALAPVDMADARYRLALALHEAGDVAGARREVLRVLEEAPSFAPAQDLLLKLQGSTPGGTR